VLALPVGAVDHRQGGGLAVRPRCGQLMTGRGLHARYCGPACTRKARYARWVAAGRPCRAGRWAAVAAGAPGGSHGQHGRGRR
jgi:hypothetical protein